jgi:ribosomal protein S18 acetylase RimI-like enzyme
VATKKEEKIEVELYALWARYRTDILRTEARCFGPNGSDEGDLELEVKSALFLAVIRKGDRAFGYCLVNRRWPDTAYINFTAIDPEFQDKGHLGTLISAVEDELRLIGYQYMERNCRIQNGYADKVQTHYAGRIVSTHDHQSLLGPLRFFRIALNKTIEPVTGEERV